MAVVVKLGGAPSAQGAASCAALVVVGVSCCEGCRAALLLFWAKGLLLPLPCTKGSAGDRLAAITMRTVPMAISMLSCALHWLSHLLGLRPFEASSACACIAQCSNASLSVSPKQPYWLIAMPLTGALAHRGYSRFLRASATATACVLELYRSACGAHIVTSRCCC